MSTLTNGYRDEGFHVPLFQKQPPCHPYLIHNDGILEGCCSILAVPMPFESDLSDGVYKKGSIAWSQFNRTFQQTPRFSLAFGMFATVMEQANYGCVSFAGRPGTDSVRATQIAYVRTLLNRERRKDKTKLSETTSTTGILHQRTHDAAVSSVVHDIVSGRYNARLPGFEHRAAVDEDVLPDGMDVGAQVARAARAGARMRDGFFGGGGRGGGHGDGDGDDNQEIDQEDEFDIALRAILDERLDGTEGHDLEPKVKVVVVHMSRPVVDENGAPVLDNVRDEDAELRLEPILDDDGDPVFHDIEGYQLFRHVQVPKQDDAGCIVFFCITDPLYSIGKAIEDLISMCEEHVTTRQGVRVDPGAARDASGTAGQVAGYLGRGMRDQTSRLQSMFPFWNSEENKANPVHGLNKETYLDLAAFVMDDPELKTTKRAACLGRGMQHPGTVRDPNPLSPVNLFTVEWACRVMQAAGVPLEQCDVRRFFGDAYDAGNGALATGSDQPGIHFPPHQSYYWPQEAWVYAKSGYYGLSRQTFPWIEMPEPLLVAARAQEMATTLEVTRYEGENDRDPFAPNYTRAAVRRGMGVIEPLPRAPYDPHAIEKRDALRSVGGANRMMIESIRPPLNPLSDLERYNLLCGQMNNYRRAAFQRVQQILTPDSAIPKSYKAILTWMGANVKHVTDHLQLFTWDATKRNPELQEMDAFAHYMAREALYVRYHRHIVSSVRQWQIVHYGSLDCYRMTGVDIHVSCIFHGPSQTGKSFMVKDATEKTCIPGTVTTQLEESNRAMNVHNDINAEIIFRDEVPDYIVNAKAAENDKSGRAERTKSAMTDQKATYAVMTFTDQKDNGRQKREQEMIETAIHTTTMCCTNKKVGQGEEAMASRFLNFTSVRRQEVNLFEYMGLKDKLDDNDSQMNSASVKAMRVKQALVAIVSAFIDGSGLPDVSMDAFDLILGRMLSYMDKHGVDTKEIRTTQMVRRLAQVYVVLAALIELYDRPGAKYAGEVFAMDQLLSAIPHLYCTKQIAFFTISQCSEIFVQPMRDAVLRAAATYAGFPVQNGMFDVVTVLNVNPERAGYDPKTISWRFENEDETERAKTRSEVMVNLNYLAINGKVQETQKAIAQKCVLGIGYNEVDACLAALSNVHITVHKVKLVQKSWFDSLVPATFANYKFQRDEHTSRIPAVVRDFAAARVFIAVEAIDLMNDRLLLEALSQCVHDGFRPQEILLGMHPERRLPFPKSGGAEFMQQDVEAGSEMDNSLQMHEFNGLYEVWRVTELVREQFSSGQTFQSPDVTFIPPLVRELFAGPSRDPDKAAAMQSVAMSDYAEKQCRMTSTKEIVEDIDDWAHRLHHVRSFIPGRPEDGEGRQGTIFTSMRTALRILATATRKSVAKGERTFFHIPKGGIQYPDALIGQDVRMLYEFEEARKKGDTSFMRTKVYESVCQAWQTAGIAKKPMKPLMINVVRRSKQYEASYRVDDVVGSAAGERFAANIRGDDDDDVDAEDAPPLLLEGLADLAILKEAGNAEQHSVGVAAERRREAREALKRADALAAQARAYKFSAEDLGRMRREEATAQQEMIERRAKILCRMQSVQTTTTTPKPAPPTTTAGSGSNGGRSKRSSSSSKKNKRGRNNEETTTMQPMPLLMDEETRPATSPDRGDDHHETDNGADRRQRLRASSSSNGSGSRSGRPVKLKEKRKTVSYANADELQLMTMDLGND